MAIVHKSMMDVFIPKKQSIKKQNIWTNLKNPTLCLSSLTLFRKPLAIQWAIDFPQPLDQKHVFFASMQLVLLWYCGMTDT